MTKSFSIFYSVLKTNLSKLKAIKVLCLIFLLPLISLVSNCPSTNVKYIGLRHLGKFSGVNDEGTAYEKTYYVSNYLKMTPPSARSFCKSFGVNVDLVSFESRDEFLVVRSKFEPEVRDQSIFVIIGGFAETNTNLNTPCKNYYHWIASGSKTFANLEASADKMCLGIKKEKNEPVTFIPVSCEESLKFMCQEMDIQYAN